jgi:VRR-NUC domain
MKKIRKGPIKYWTQSRKQISLAVDNKESVPTELVEQIKLATWLDKHGIRFFAIPNGGWRSMSEGVKFKRSGVKSGVPDICIPLPVEPYHGLYIELKRVRGGVLSEVQAEWLEFLNGKGYKASVARGFDEARDIIENYLNGSPKFAA